MQTRIKRSSMKTAIEWLDEQLQIMDSKSFNNLIQIEMGRDNYKEVIEQAKEMEKEQIIDAYETAMETDIYTTPLKVGEQYYNETFKSE
jgi:hypothetical protein